LFPETFGETSRLGRHAGLLITSGLVLIIANRVDVSAIASVGSAVSLMVFLFVGIAGWRRRADTNSNPVIVAVAIAATGMVLGFFAVDTLQTVPETFTATIVLGLLAIVLDALVRRHQRTLRPPEGRPSPSASPRRLSTNQSGEGWGSSCGS
jgi:amino acid transporter